MRMRTTLLNIEPCLESAKSNRLTCWDRSTTQCDTSSLLPTSPYAIKESFPLAPARTRALMRELKSNSLRIELTHARLRANPHIIHTEETISARPLNTAAGFSLIELLVVVALISMIAAFTIPRLYGRNDQQLIQNEIAARLKERREAARHLAPKTSATATADFTQPPLVIDFKTPQST